AGQPPVLDNAEVSVILAVFASICAAQKHLSAAAWQRSISQKRGKVFTWPVSAIATLKAKGILLLEDRKCDLSAKVRLALLSVRHQPFEISSQNRLRLFPSHAQFV